MGRQDFTTSQPSLPYPQAPARHTLGPLAATPGGSLAPGKCPWSQVLGKQRHLKLGMKGRNRRHPRTPDKWELKY
jgi:hypothetical protein